MSVAVFISVCEFEPVMGVVRTIHGYRCGFTELIAAQNTSKLTYISHDFQRTVTF